MGAQPVRLSSVIDALSEPRFGAALFNFLRQHCALDHVATYRVNGESCQPIAAASRDGSDDARRQMRCYTGGGYWRRDDTLVAARSDPLGLATPYRMTAAMLRDRGMASVYRPVPIGDRVVFWKHAGASMTGLSVLRGIGSRQFDSRDVEALAEWADDLIALVAKHGDLVREASPPLDNHSEIELRLRTIAPALTDRERSVCAGILFGMMAEGIASGLGIAVTSVVTYRRRAYARLGIASRHELMRFYLTVTQ